MACCNEDVPAEAGGIYVSRAVNNCVKTIIDVGFESLGERRLN